MIMKKIHCLLIVLTLVGLNNLSSQDVWSLEKCILHSQDASISVNQAELSIRQAHVTLNQAKQSRLPSLSGNANVGWNFGRTVDPTTNEFITETFFSNRYGLSSNVILFNGMQINNSIKQSKIDLEASRNETEQVRRDVALTVASNYLNVLFAIENIEISERQLELSRQQLDRTLKEIDAGRLPAAERLNLEAQIAQSEQMLIQSRNAYDIAILQLKQVLRLDPSFPFEVVAPEGVPVSTDPDMVDFEEAFAEAQKNRPDLYGQGLRVQSADLGVKLAKGDFLPTVSAFGSLGSAYSNQAREAIDFMEVDITTPVVISSNDPRLPVDNLPAELKTSSIVPITDKPAYSTQLDNNLSYGFGFSVGIPIYRNGITKSSVQRAKLNAINSQLQYDQILENLKIAVQQSIADARAAKKKLEASEKSLNAQKLAFDNTNKRLEIGAANTFEWESQKTQMENAEIQVLIDKYDYLFKIKILEFYLGKPLKL